MLTGGITTTGHIGKAMLTGTSRRLTDLSTHPTLTY